MFALHFSPLYGFFIAVAVDNFLPILAARHVHRHLAHTLEAALDAFSDPFIGRDVVQNISDSKVGMCSEPGYFVIPIFNIGQIKICLGTVHKYQDTHTILIN